MKIATALILALTGVVWGLAVFLERPPPPLDDRYCGRFQAVDYVDREGAASPFPPGQQQDYEFRKDGTYLMRYMLWNGEEMLRREGTVHVDEERAILTLRQVSENKDEARGEASYRLHWDVDDKGKYLRLTSREQGFRFLLRPNSAR